MAQKIEENDAIGLIRKGCWIEARLFPFLHYLSLKHICLKIDFYLELNWNMEW
jgi:hypothetical protein